MVRCTRSIPRPLLPHTHPSTRAPSLACMCSGTHRTWQGRTRSHQLTHVTSHPGPRGNERPQRKLQSGRGLPFQRSMAPDSTCLGRRRPRCLGLDSCVPRVSAPRPAPAAKRDRGIRWEGRGLPAAGAPPPKKKIKLEAGAAAAAAPARPAVKPEPRAPAAQSRPGPTPPGPTPLGRRRCDPECEGIVRESEAGGRERVVMRTCWEGCDVCIQEPEGSSRRCASFGGPRWFTKKHGGWCRDRSLLPVVSEGRPRHFPRAPFHCVGNLSLSPRTH